MAIAVQPFEGTYFEADVHPLITVRSTSVVLEDDRHARVAGELAIRGVSRPVAASGTYARSHGGSLGLSRVSLELQATVDRRSWDMNWQLPLPDGGEALGWEVEITAHLELGEKA